MNLRWLTLASTLLLFLTTGAALAAHTERVSISSAGQEWQL